MATLKISDLSVGDWVYYGNETTPYSIRSIYNTNVQECVVLNDSKFPEGVLAFVDKLKPIPITAEMLEKNGFEEDNNGHYALKIGGIVAVDLEYTREIWELSILDVYALQYAGKMQVTIAFVSSVHSLQHALRLAGVDKEINL